MADPDGERAPQAVRWAVLAMYGGAALTVALTAAALAHWYFQEYLPANRPTFVHGDSGLSISSSPFFAWFYGLGGLLICSLWLWMARMCAPGNLGGVEVQRDAERLDDVGGPALAGDGPASVLDDPGPGGGGHQGGHGRDIDGVRAVAPGAGRFTGAGPWTR